jgi:hypothetical protein
VAQCASLLVDKKQYKATATNLALTLEHYYAQWVRCGQRLGCLKTGNLKLRVGGLCRDLYRMSITNQSGIELKIVTENWVTNKCLYFRAYINYYKKVNLATDLCYHVWVSNLIKYRLVSLFRAGKSSSRYICIFPYLYPLTLPQFSKPQSFESWFCLSERFYSYMEFPHRCGQWFICDQTWTVDPSIHYNP